MKSCGFYRSLTSIGTCLQPILLLVLRLIWGTILFQIGLVKLLSIASVVQLFETLGIPFPTYTAYVVGSFECVCGLFLLLGLLSRLAALPIICIMIVALATAHADALKHIVENPLILSEQPPFPFLLLALIVFAFGPGKYSIDACICKRIDKDKTACATDKEL